MYVTIQDRFRYRRECMSPGFGQYSEPIHSHCGNEHETAENRLEAKNMCQVAYTCIAMLINIEGYLFHQMRVTLKNMAVTLYV